MPFKMVNYYIWYAFEKNTAKYADLTEKGLEERWNRLLRMLK